MEWTLKNIIKIVDESKDLTRDRQTKIALSMPNFMIHTTIGLYADGSFKMNGVKPEHLEEHLLYNKTYRSRAMFVDGKCVDKGYISEEKVKAFEEYIKRENLKVDKCTAPYQ